MTPAIFGISGLELTADERAFFKDADPAGYILFGRNCDSTDQLRKLTDDLREIHGRERLIVSIDQEGIVAGLATFFAAREIEIADLNTRQYNAAHTGAAMFSVQMAINIPATIHLATLREEFHEFCEEKNLDAIIEPIQR